MTRLEPELTWVDGRFRRDLAVVIDAATGRIVRVERAGGDSGDGTGDRRGGDRAGERGGTGSPLGAAVALPGRALIPGFVNGHSHAFQRLARGRTQTRPAGREASDFWSWREAMYGMALSLSAEDVYHVSRFAFLEMMRTGITAVGEFHYLHHQPDGRAYADPNEMAMRVIAAAEDVGMRITLLNVCYATGGIGEPLEERQRRFRAISLDAYLEGTARLAERVGPPGSEASSTASLVSMGVAPHSVRAVPRSWLPQLRQWATERDLPIHMHVSERPAEVEASRGVYGLRPVELLAEDGILDHRFTAVHATHLSDAEIRLLADSGATVCACPTTERDLGDGLLRGRDLLEAGVPISLGTDSHTSLDFLEEMRLVEYHERLQRLERVVLTDGARADGERHQVAPVLLDMGTVAGARSLRLDAGRLAPGALADIVALDLTHHSLAGWTDDTLAATVTLSATPDIVRDVWVGGVRRLEDRRHTAEEDVVAGFRAVVSARG